MKRRTLNVSNEQAKAKPRRHIKIFKTINLQPSIVILFVAVVALLSIKLYNDASITELAYQKIEKTNTLSEMQNQLTKLNVDISKRANLKEIELRAKTELGLTKIEKYQIEYVNINVDNKITTYKNEENSIFSGIGRSFSTIMEFLN
ncbi:MAG: hypothetical protein RR436_01350 [Clostridia bacterium]